MINATHYVLDLETMGKGPTAAIVAIGCVRIEQGTITGSFYRRVSLQTSLLAGLQVDASLPGLLRSLPGVGTVQVQLARPWTAAN